MTDGRDAAALLRSVGLLADGPVVLGRPLRAARAGVYLVELPAAVSSAPIELTRVGKWLERVETLRLDGARPTSRALAARLAAFWLPSQPVLFVGSTTGSVAARVAAIERHVLGDRRPAASSHWLQALRVPTLRVWWAHTDAAEEYEDALLDAFAAGVPEEERRGLPDQALILPFANLRTPTGQRKQHGITGSLLPEEAAPAAPPGRVVTLPDGDAEGARREDKGTGTVRRAPRAPAAAGTGPRAGQPAARTPGAGGGRRAPEPVHLSPAGVERLRGELEELIRVRRPEVIARIRAAKELGDLRENADYTAAREEQSFLEGRIQALEGRLRAAVVVDEAPADRVGIGSRVEIELDGERSVLTIVGSAESDPAAGRISAASPVGRALLGHGAGDEVTVQTPRGAAHYRVVSVE